MKKVILSIAIAFAAAVSADAQKQTGGEKNLEVQFAPLGGNPVSISGIRLRIFNSESSAIRIGLNVGGSSSKEITQEQSNDANLIELSTTNKTFNFSIRPGYEKHFAGTDRLSPYIGGELLIGIARSTDITETQYGDEELQIQTDKSGSTTFGINAVAGTDFYFADNIYLGAEIGFGFSRTADGDNETTFENAPDGVDDVTSILNNTTNSSWGPNFQGTLRLGWLFN